MTDENHFRGHVTQKGVVFGPQNDILLVRQAEEYPWVFPGGRVQVGEDADEGLRRELCEETGLEVTVGQPVHALTDAWFTEDGEPMFTVIYRCEADSREVTLNHEHEQWQWVDPEAAVEELELKSLGDAVERALAIE